MVVSHLILIPTTHQAFINRINKERSTFAPLHIQPEYELLIHIHPLTDLDELVIFLYDIPTQYQVPTM